MTTSKSSIINDITPAEAANLLAKLEDGHQAAWRSTRDAQWDSPEYQSRFQNAAELDGIIRDLMQETIDNGMRRLGELVEEFAERAGSEAWLAATLKADSEPHADPIGQQTGTGTSRERAGESCHQAAARLLNDARTPEGQAYARAFSDTTAVSLKELRERDPLPQPDRTPGGPHPDPFLAGRGWHVNEHGIYSRRAQPERQPPPERDLEAGL